MHNLYYIETNIICMFILGILLQMSRLRASGANSSAQIVLRYFLVSGEVVCLSDLLAGVCRGATFQGAHWVVLISNMVYIEAMAAVSVFWCMYVIQRSEVQIALPVIRVMMLPFALITVAVLSNPFTQLLFTVNDQNLYARGKGIVLHWLVSWFYILAATFITLSRFRKAKRSSQKREFGAFLLFTAFSGFACLFQMAFYGSTTIQVGFTLPVLLLVLQSQESRVGIDELTGINSRRALDPFVETVVGKNAEELTVLMMDVNHFKMINDQFGHLVGDSALRDTADALKEACGSLSNRYLLCRYGGDEFLVVIKSISVQALDELVTRIRDSVSRIGEQNNRPYSLQISIGISNGVCNDQEDFRHQVRVADEAMYADKKRLKMTR